MSLPESLDSASLTYCQPSPSLHVEAFESRQRRARQDYGSLSIVRRFEHNVRDYPERTAARCNDESVSYQQLNEQANALARHLRRLGVHGNVPVCVFLEPSIQSVVAVIALLKIGAIYVPLDTEHPHERLNAIIDDVKPALIVTRQRFAERVDAIDRHLVLLDNTTFFEEADRNDEAAGENIGGEIAYIFYTSGTTGKPKGVMGSQANLIQYVMSAVRTYAMGPETIMPALARFTFSISVFELLCPLIAGGCVVVLSREHILDLPRLAKTLEDVTMFHIGPSLLKKLIATINASYTSFHPFAKMHHVSSGGDIVRPALMESMKAVFSNAELFVIYGCNEVACMGCTYPIPRHSVVEKTLVGSPFANVGVQLFNEAGESVTAGTTVGEIYFCGNGVTQGYLNLPHLTAEKYVELNGERFYRTGDLGRLDAFGNLEMLGRSDFQVKLRGIRVELGEIEVHLQRIPGVVDAVAAAIDSGGERRLCAYLVLDKTQPPGLDVIKHHLEQQLPDYMIPAYFVGLDKLPLNHNLKIDRKALPLPDHSNLLTSDTFIAPTNTIEFSLIEIWQDILKMDGIGTQHNFFELGGDSLLAANLLVDVERKFGRQIPLTALFAAPTVADIARLLAEQQSTAVDSDLFVVRSGSKPALFMLHGALIYRDLGAYLEPDQAACVLCASEEARLIGAKNASEFMKIYSGIEVLAARYLRAIKLHQPEGPYHLCGFSMGGLVALEVARMLEEAGSQVGKVFLLDCFVPSFLAKFSWRKLAFHARDLMTRGVPYIQAMTEKFVANVAAKRSLVAAGQAPALLDSFAHVEELRRIARNSATADYFPKRFSGKVVLFKAMERVGYEPKDHTLGWGKLIPDLDIYDVPGDHHGILKADNARFIADKVTRYLNSDE